MKKYGNHAVEYDVQLSSDKVPILHHDVKLGRTVQRTGNVADYTAAELNSFDAGSWHKSVLFAGSTIPLYRDVVSYCRANKIWMNVELKGDFTKAHELRKIGSTVAALTKAIYKDELSHEVADYSILPLFSSFSSEALEEALLVAPYIPRALLVRGIGEEEGFVPSMKDLLVMLGRLEASACHINHQGLQRADVSALLAEGYSVMCYTVNCSQRLSELESYGVQSVCTDRFDLGLQGIVSRM